MTRAVGQRGRRWAGLILALTCAMGCRTAPPAPPLAPASPRETPDLHPDLDRFVHTGQHGTPPTFGLFETAVRDGATRTLLESPRWLGSPRYVPGGVAFLMDPGDGTAAVHSLSLKDRSVRRLSFHPGRDSGLVVTPNGRLVFGSSELGGLLSMRWDGTGVWSWHEPDHAAAASASPVPVRWDAAAGGLVARSGSGALVLFPAADHYYGARPLAVDGNEAPPDAQLRPAAAPCFEPSLVRPAEATGEIFCQDALFGIPQARGLAPAKCAVRVTCEPLRPGARAVTRDFPLAADGSFYLRAAADQPLRLSILDPGGRVLQAMKSHFWVRPGEQRGCIGCHEHRGRAPWNRVTLALDRPPGEVRLP